MMAQESLITSGETTETAALTAGHAGQEAQATKRTEQVEWARTANAAARKGQKIGGVRVARTIEMMKDLMNMEFLDPARPTRGKAGMLLTILGSGSVISGKYRNLRTFLLNFNPFGLKLLLRFSLGWSKHAQTQARMLWKGLLNGSSRYINYFFAWTGVDATEEGSKLLCGDASSYGAEGS
jgi:hypothetical protein